MSFIFPNFQDEWPQLDPPDVLLSLPAAAGGVRHSLLHQLHRDLLPRLPRHPLRHHGGRHLHLHLRHPPPHPGRHSARQKSGGKSWLPLQVALFNKHYTLTLIKLLNTLYWCWACCSLPADWIETFLFRINAVPRPIPEKKWFMEPWVIILVGGILPFGSIFIEMYFIFTSFWAYKIYYVYGFMLLGEGNICHARHRHSCIRIF